VAAALGEGVDMGGAELPGAAEGLVELRIDLFAERGGEAVLARARACRPATLLATIRSAREGGQWDGDEGERLALFRAVIPGVDAVDIELSSRDILDEVAAAAKSAGKTVIISFHDFESTPELGRLAEICAEARKKGADIVKIATFARDPRDIRVLARLTLDEAEKDIITVGMGPLGALTRIFFPALGSLLTYAHAGAATAPGQLNYRRTRELLDLFYPR
jgi:3-dehydroquinate dehydratase-1